MQRSDLGCLPRGEFHLLGTATARFLNPHESAEIRTVYWLGWGCSQEMSDTFAGIWLILY